MEQGNIKKNFILNSMYQILTIIIPIFLTPYLSRVLGSEGIGKYSYYYSCAYYFTLFAMLGIPNYGNRAIAKVRDDINERSRTFWEVYKLQLITTSTILIIYILTVHIFLEDNPIAWMFSLFVLACCFDISWFFFGMEQFKVTVGRNFLIKMITIICIFLFVKDLDDVFLYALISSIGVLIANILLFTILKINKECGKIYSINKKHIRPILILFLPYLAVSIYTIMDKIMLGLMSTMNEVGYYESSERVIKLPMAFVSSLGTIMIPRISNMLSKNKENESQSYMSKSIILIMFLVSAMCLGVVAVADIFVPLFYGEGFEKCIELFMILMPSCIFMAFANVIRTQYLVPHEMDKQFSVSLLIGAGINIMLNLFLIPKYASIGAAIATLITEAVVCICQCWSVRKYIPLKKYILQAFPFIFAGIVMCVAVRAFFLEIESLIILLTIKIFGGAVVYLFVLGCMYFLQKNIVEKKNVHSI